MDESTLYVEQIDKYLSIQTLTLPEYPGRKIIFCGMNHAAASEEEYNSLLERIKIITSNNANIEVLTEGIHIDEERKPVDEVKSKYFEAMTFILEGMDIIAADKQKSIQGNLINELKDSGVEVNNADIMLSDLVDLIYSENIPLEFIEDSLTYKIGKKKDPNLDFKELISTKYKASPTELEELQNKYQRILIVERNKIPINRIRSTLAKDKDCLVIYGSAHIEDMIKRLRS